jgi:hypothetical protein
MAGFRVQVQMQMRVSTHEGRKLDSTGQLPLSAPAPRSPDTFNLLERDVSTTHLQPTLDPTPYTRNPLPKPVFLSAAAQRRVLVQVRVQRLPKQQARARERRHRRRQRQQRAQEQAQSSRYVCAMHLYVCVRALARV